MLCYNMAAYTLAVFFVSTICMHQSFAGDPALPSFSGDISISGYVRTAYQGKTPFKYWISDTLKASRTDIIFFEMIGKQYDFETKGQYGTSVGILSHGGHQRCSYTEGTAEKPVKCESMFPSSKDNKYVGTEILDGVELQKWEYNNKEGKPQTLYIRQDVSGPVPVRIVKAGKTIDITHFSSSPIPAATFEYNPKGCTEETKKTARSRPYGNLRIFNQ